MMRSLFSGVSGLKVHQTKMDVLGNNIANVNTVGFKASSVRFSDVFYQTTQSATGPNAATGAGGRNAKQIGLGANVMSIATNIAGEGASQRTDSALDMKLSGGSFFIVNSGGMNYFTRSGVFDIDAQGTLTMAGLGATVMGWQVDPNDPTSIIRDTVSPLRIMSPENVYAEPELTTNLYVTGNIDNKDADLQKSTGVTIQTSFYDNMGGSYTARYKIVQSVTGTPPNTTPVEGEYEIELVDVVDSKNKSIFATYDSDGNITGPSTTTAITLGGQTYDVDVTGAHSNPAVAPGSVVIAPATGSDPNVIKFDAGTGAFVGVGASATPPTTDPSIKLLLTDSTGKFDGPIPTGQTTYPGIDMNFSSVTMYETGGKTILNPYKGDLETGNGAGRKVGTMTGFSVSSDGRIYGSYDNGVTRLLGQIATASFSNPAGLESVGNNMYATTQNSGEFDGVGKDPTEGGGSLSTGILEMSNVDLSTEFTEMIVTQRGFQANSKIITTSDALLDELINLKR